jgi:hypothetical protein
LSIHPIGPRALADPAANISDVFAFPAPENAQQLVIVMDVFGKAGPSAVFSDAVIYRFRSRPVDIAATGQRRHSRQVKARSHSTECSTFRAVWPAQHGRSSTAAVSHRAGRTISFRVDDENGGMDDGNQIFAGQRSEPFFLDVRMLEKTYHDDALIDALAEALVDVWERLRLPLRYRALAAE